MISQKQRPKRKRKHREQRRQSVIFNSNKIYAKVWKVKPADNKKYIDLQITTSEKNQDDEYINSGWFPRAIGHAVNSLKNVKEGDRIVNTKSKFTNERHEDNDGNKKSFFRFLILEASVEKQENGASAKSSSDKKKKMQDEDDEDCPW